MDNCPAARIQQVDRLYSPAHLSEWEEALDANLEYCWKVHKLEVMAHLAEEIGERSWAHRLHDELGRIKEGVAP